MNFNINISSVTSLLPDLSEIWHYFWLVVAINDSSARIPKLCPLKTWNPIVDHARTIPIHVHCFIAKWYFDPYFP